MSTYTELLDRKEQLDKEIGFLFSDDDILNRLERIHQAMFDIKQTGHIGDSSKELSERQLQALTEAREVYRSLVMNKPKKPASREDDAVPAAQPDLSDEELLSYLINDLMTREQKLKALSDAWWYATNSGYGDAMANRLMSGIEDEQTKLWELNCKNKSAINRCYNKIKEEADSETQY